MNDDLQNNVLCISNIKRTKTHNGNIKIGKDGQVDLRCSKGLALSNQQ